MKRLLPMLCLLLIPALALSLRVDIGVTGNIGGNVEYFDIEQAAVQKFMVQWYNSESVNCMSRLEFIIEDENYTKSVWTNSKKMLSGVSDYFEAYWLPPHSGNYSMTMVIHHCYDIVESEPIEFSVGEIPESEDAIEIGLKNLPESRIEITLKSERDVKDVVVIPKNYPYGWIFPAGKLDLESGKENKLVIEYEPSVFTEESVTFHAVSADGKYSSKPANIVLREEKYFWDGYGMIVTLIITFLFVVSIIINVRFIKTMKYRKL